MILILKKLFLFVLEFDVSRLRRIFSSAWIFVDAHIHVAVRSPWTLCRCNFDCTCLLNLNIHNHVQEKKLRTYSLYPHYFTIGIELLDALKITHSYGADHVGHNDGATSQCVRSPSRIFALGAMQVSLITTECFARQEQERTIAHLFYCISYRLVIILPWHSDNRQRTCSPCDTPNHFSRRRSHVQLYLA